MSKVFVQTRDDVPAPARFAPEGVGVEPGRHRLHRRHRVTAVVLLLLHAVRLGHRARVEGLDGFGGVEIPALDLAVGFVGFAEASLEAYEGFVALLVGEASRELFLALGEEALAGLDGARVRADGGGGSGEGERDRGGRGEGDRAVANFIPPRPGRRIRVILGGRGAGGGGRGRLGGGARDDRGGEPSRVVRGGSGSDDGDSARMRRLARGNLHSSDTGDVMGRALCAREHGHRREALPALDAIRLAD